MVGQCALGQRWQIIGWPTVNNLRWAYVGERVVGRRQIMNAGPTLEIGGGRPSDNVQWPYVRE